MEQANIKDIVKKMQHDKKVTKDYIQKNGSLKGFDDKSIIFAKPL